jgi:ribosomal protein S18 acetylase RimI-like enzyme
MRHDTEWVRIQLLSSEDHRIFDTAVKTFRRVEVVDHGPFLRDPASIAFVATADDQLLGWAWGTRQRHAAGYSQVQLYEIEVVETERRHGVGRSLLTAFLHLARREGHRKMWLFTDEHNTAAQALYRSAGGEPSPHEDAAFWWQLSAESGSTP